jgi:hypothetical protein
MIADVSCRSTSKMWGDWPGPGRPRPASTRVVFERPDEGVAVDV